MSYSNIKNLSEIINKRVLFYDLETTGLVKTQRGIKPEEEYPDYKDLEKYNNARIVSIGWLYLEEFDYDYEIGIENINEKIIKPEGFVIPDEAIKIHGITNEKAKKEGKKLKESLKKFGKIIKKCEYIIGYNVYYDINVLLSELYRKKRTKTIEKILKLKEEEKIICLGQISSKEIPPDKFKKYNQYAIPKQTEVYKKCYNEELANAHNAKSDVFGLIKIMFWIYENKLVEKYMKITGIDEFDNLEVSNFGNVRNIYSQNLLKGQIYKKGILYEYNKKRIYAHELVALYYLPKPEEDKILIHLDKNTLNNNISNLKWIEKTEINTEENHGKKWEEKEYEELIKEVKNKKSLKNITLNHKRKYGGIKSAINKLMELKKITNKQASHYNKFTEEQNIEKDDKEEPNIKKYFDKKMIYSKNKVNNISELCHRCFSELEEYCSSLYMCKKNGHVICVHCGGDEYNGEVYSQEGEFYHVCCNEQW